MRRHVEATLSLAVSPIREPPSPNMQTLDYTPNLITLHTEARKKRKISSVIQTFNVTVVVTEMK